MARPHTQVRDAKHPVNAAAAGPYGHPYHPILITVPVGTWIASLIFDIGSKVVDDPGYLTRGSEWLIAIGVIGAVLAALAGLMDAATIPKGTPAKKTAGLHMSLNTLVLAAYVVNWFWRVNSSSTGSVHNGQLILNIVSIVVLTVSGTLGGQLAYRYGVRVVDERTQSTGYLGR